MNSNNTMHADAIESAAQDSIDSVEDKVLDSLDKARDASTKAGEKVASAEEDLQKAIQSATESITGYINEKPLQAAGIAFTAGVLATLLLSRR